MKEVGSSMRDLENYTCKGLIIRFTTMPWGKGICFNMLMNKKELLYEMPGDNSEILF